VGGTSVATVLVASMYALAGGPRPGSYPAAYPYLNRSGLRDVTSGRANGSCETYRRYLCQPGPGYDGPTGLGVPYGTRSFTAPAGPLVTIADPGTLDYRLGTVLRLRLRASGTGTGTLGYIAAGLPAGLRLNHADGLITGRLTGPPGSYQVHAAAVGPRVIARPGSHRSVPPGQSLVTFSIVVVRPMTARYNGSGQVRLGPAGRCLTGQLRTGRSRASRPRTGRRRTDRAGGEVVLSACADGRAAGRRAQDWRYSPASAPGGAGLLLLADRCLSTGAGRAAGRPVTLRSCTGSAAQRWSYLMGGELVSLVTGRCLAAGSRDGGRSATRLALGPCASAAAGTWLLPPGPVLSGLGNRCLTGPAAVQPGAAEVTVSDCGGRPGQRWQSRPDGSLRSGGRCLAVADGSHLDGAGIVVASCRETASQRWLNGPGGELLNASSGRCLAVRTARSGRAAGATRLVQQDCYGTPGEIWSVG
jgi:hypothetical protein